MTDLELIIQELKVKKDHFQKQMEREGGDSEAHRHLSAIEGELFKMRQLHPDEPSLIEEENRARRTQNNKEMLKRHLMRDISILSKQDLEGKEFASAIKHIVEKHLQRRKAPFYNIREPETIPQKNNSKFEEDRIYDLLEKVHDNKMTSFQVKSYKKNIKNDIGLEVNSQNDEITLKFLMDDSYRTKSYMSAGIILLKKIGYRFDDPYWIMTLDRDANGFQLLVEAVSRTLFDIMGAYKEVTLVYEEEE